MKEKLKKVLISLLLLGGLFSHIYFNNTISINVYYFIVAISWVAISLQYLVVYSSKIIIKDFDVNKDLSKLEIIRNLVKPTYLPIKICSWIMYGLLIYLGNIWLVVISFISSAINKGYIASLKEDLNAIDEKLNIRTLNE